MKYWITQTGQKIAIKDMTKEHIENCIRLYERLLAQKPDTQYYMGDSDYAESAVEQENCMNDDLEEVILARVKSFKRVLKGRDN